MMKKEEKRNERKGTEEKQEMSTFNKGELKVTKGKLATFRVSFGCRAVGRCMKSIRRSAFHGSFR